MNIVNLPIDVMVAKEVVEKRVIEEEEGCLVLLEKKLPRNMEEQFSLRNVFQFVVLYPIVASTKV